MSSSALISLALVIALAVAAWLTWRRGSRSPTQRLLKELAADLELRFAAPKRGEIGSIEGRINGYAVRIWATASGGLLRSRPPQFCVATLLPTPLTPGTVLWRRTGAGRLDGHQRRDLSARAQRHNGAPVSLSGNSEFDRRFAARGNLRALHQVLTPKVQRLLMARASSRGDQLEVDHEWILQRFDAAADDPDLLKETLAWQVELAEALWQAAAD